MKKYGILLLLLSGFSHQILAGGGMNHMQLIQALIADNEITHTATQNGSWFATQTWQNGQIPNANAKVLIPHNINVTYDSTSNTAIYGIKVRGVLNFSPSQSSLLRIDTLT